MSYEPSKKSCLFAVAIIAALLLLALGWMSGGAYTETIPRPFDSSAWKKADIDGEARCGMVADLRWRIGLVGKTRNEIAQLLGPVDGKESDPTTSYWLLCPSFMDIWVLEVRWSNDRVIAAWVRDT